MRNRRIVRASEIERLQGDDEGRSLSARNRIKADRHGRQDGRSDGPGGMVVERSDAARGRRDSRRGGGARAKARDGCDRDREVDLRSSSSIDRRKGKLVRVRSRPPCGEVVVGLVLVLALVASLGTGGAAAKTSKSNITGLTVFAAASLTDVLPRSTADPKYSFGSSGTLATQINNGAPADVFLAAATTSRRSSSRREVRQAGQLHAEQAGDRRAEEQPGRNQRHLRPDEAGHRRSSWRTRRFRSARTRSRS